MNALFLGGNSPRHQVWIHEMANALSAPLDKAVIHEYMHWETGEKSIDMDHEISKIGIEMADLKPYLVFAKSIGTMITLKAMYEKVINPEACVFLGLPLNAITDMGLPVQEWLESVRVPIYFLHNQNDPYGSADELKAMLPDNIDQSNITVLPGETHDYNDVSVMSDLLARAGA
jgi:hypothetical protein